MRTSLFNEKTFYEAFAKDLDKCHKRLIIESPFITSNRAYRLLPILQRLRDRGIKVMINTRNPEEHEESLRRQAYEILAIFQEMGIEILHTGGHHRKLAIVDSSILWEGSLNIFSQNDSCEIMRRTKSKRLVREMITFINLTHFLK